MRRPNSCSPEVLSQVSQRLQHLNHQLYTVIDAMQTGKGPSLKNPTAHVPVPISVILLFMCHRVGLARKCMLTEEERWRGDERVLFPGEVSAAHEHVCLNIENKERHLVQTPHWVCNAFDSEQRASQSQKLLPRGQK